jgi:cytochrome P450
LDVYSYSRDPDYYPDPLVFDPERWNDESRHSQLLLFGMGARACFGRRLATTEIKLFLFTMLQKYEVEAVSEKIDVEFHFGLRPKHGEVKIILKPLQNM